MKLTATVSLLLAASVSTVSALGINCRGSGWCDFADDDVAQSLSTLLQGVDDNRWYDNGEHIGCVQSSGSYIADQAQGDIGFCAFLQNTGGTWGSIIKQLAPYIPGHGCRVCGSVPYYFPEGNNNCDDGMLTFNMVTMPKGTVCTSGLC